MPSPSSAGERDYCFADLMTPPLPDIPADMMLGSAKEPFPFRQTDCMTPLPGRGSAIDRPMLCALYIASGWRYWQYLYRFNHQIPADSLDLYRQIYSATARSLDDPGRQYLDDVLLSLDRDHPVDEVRPAPGDTLSFRSLRDEPVRTSDTLRLHRLLRDAWADTFVGLLRSDQSVHAGQDSTVSVIRTIYRHSFKIKTTDGMTGVDREPSVITACEDVLPDLRVLPDEGPAACAGAVANMWLSYRVTGDKRFRDVAVGIQNLVLKRLGVSGRHPATARAAKRYFQALGCSLGPENSEGC